MRDDRPVTTSAAPRAHAGVNDVLRADIRLLTTLLGQTLVRSEEQELLHLVEMVRGRARVGALTDLPAEVDARLSGSTARIRTPPRSCAVESCGIRS